MKLVTILTHGYFNDKRTGVLFSERLVSNPDPEGPPGSKVFLGVAEDVPADVVRKYYLSHKSYRTEGYLDDELWPDGVPDKIKAIRKAEADKAAQKAAEAIDAPEDTEEAEVAPEAEDEPVLDETDGLFGVTFASTPAEDMAREFGLKASHFDGITPGAQKGFNTKDVRAANKKAVAN